MATQFPKTLLDPARHRDFAGRMAKIAAQTVLPEKALLGALAGAASIAEGIQGRRYQRSLDAEIGRRSPISPVPAESVFVAGLIATAGVVADIADPLLAPARVRAAFADVFIPGTTPRNTF
jgi:hypothetical protein